MSRSSRRADRVVKGMEQIKPTIPVVDSVEIPNTMGDHARSIKRNTPVADADLANKKYVDDNVVTELEGTAILSTGEGGATNYLREDGDGTCSWQAPAGGGDVTAAVNLTANTIVQGDDGVKGVKTSTATVAQIATNVAHVAGDGSDHADVATNTAASHAAATTNANATAGGLTLSTQEINFRAATNAQTGYATAAHITAIETNTAKDTNVTTNLSLGAGNATTEVIACSDGTDCTLIEADTDNAGLLGAAKWDEIVAATTHVADNTQAHSDYLLNSGADVAVGPLTTTADNSTADQAYVAMVLYNTDDTPPAANTVPIGTIYIQYTA